MRGGGGGGNSVASGMARSKELLVGQLEVPYAHLAKQVGGWVLVGVLSGLFGGAQRLGTAEA